MSFSGRHFDYESAALPSELRWQMPVLKNFFRHFCGDFYLLPSWQAGLLRIDCSTNWAKLALRCVPTLLGKNPKFLSKTQKFELLVVTNQPLYQLSQGGNIVSQAESLQSAMNV